jgi:hypothetical protein
MDLRPIHNLSSRHGRFDSADGDAPTCLRPAHIRPRHPSTCSRLRNGPSRRAAPPSRAFFSFPPRAAAPVPTPAAINNRPFPPQLRLRSPPNPSFFLCAFPRFQLPSRQRRLASPPIPFPDRIPLETVKAKNQPRAAAVTRTRRAC